MEGEMNKDREQEGEWFLQELREQVPFLREIPDEIYFQLDTSEFYMPNGIVKEAREFLENATNQHIMTYKADKFNLNIPVSHHLCANLKPALLPFNYLQLLQNAENELRSRGNNISFSAYQKPIELTPPNESALFDFYATRELAL